MFSCTASVFLDVVEGEEYLPGHLRCRCYILSTRIGTSSCYPKIFFSKKDREEEDAEIIEERAKVQERVMEIELVLVLWRTACPL